MVASYHHRPPGVSWGPSLCGSDFCVALPRNPQAKISQVVVLAGAGSPRRAPLNGGAEIRRPNSISISVEVRRIPIPEAVDFVHTFDEFSLAFDRNVIQKMVLRRGEKSANSTH